MENNAMDPVTLEVIWNRFLSVANEQQDALIRTAFSTIVRESQDLACGMFDTKGRIISQSISGTPWHINAMSTSMKHFLAALPPDKLAPGDVLITKDTWQNAGQIRHATRVIASLILVLWSSALVACSAHCYLGTSHLGTAQVQHSCHLPKNTQPPCHGGE